MLYKVKHFKLKEFACPDCGKTRVAIPLVFWLDQIRCAIGAPVIVNSGYRCMTRNKDVGGSATSRHMIGCGADIKLGMSLTSPAGFLSHSNFLALVKRFLIDGSELVDYPKQGYIHFGVPRDCADRMWDGGEVVKL